jgi:hypothetical protein
MAPRKAEPRWPVTGIWRTSWHNMIRSLVRNLTTSAIAGIAGDHGPGRPRPGTGGVASRGDCLRSSRHRRGWRSLRGYRMGVPPVGVEPTLGTLLGGRPLPLGYGGAVMIPPPVRTILARANRGEKNPPGYTYSIRCPRSPNAQRYHFAGACIHCALSVVTLRRPSPCPPALRRSAGDQPAQADQTPAQGPNRTNPQRWQRMGYCAEGSGRPATARARWNTASSMGGVTRPVKVFCWLG